MPRNYKVIYNPTARGGKGEKIANQVEEKLTEFGVDFSISPTIGPKDAIEKAAEAKDEGYNIVVAIGGDGTANEVANGAIQADLPFGVIPAGSGNDFAMGLGIDADWEKSIEILLQNRRAKISILSLNDNRYCINVADIGLGAKVVKLSENHLKWITGSKKYTLLTMFELLRHKRYDTQLIVDGEVLDYELNILAAGFGQTFGSGMRIIPDGRFNKTEMEVVVVHGASRFTILRVFPKIFSGKHLNYDKFVDSFRAKELTIIPKEEEKFLYSEVDGELVEADQYQLKVVENGLEVIIPEEWSFDNESLYV